MVKGTRTYPFSAELTELLRDAYRTGRRREVSERLRKVMRLRPEWPAWVWFNEAARLGLQAEIGRRRWSASEDRELMLCLGSETVATIAARIGRSRRAVYQRAEKLRISTMVRDGFSETGLAACFGVSQKAVATWVEEGWLVMRAGRISEEAVAAFVRQYPQAYDLRRVDQVWFKSLLQVRVRCRV